MATLERTYEVLGDFIAQPTVSADSNLAMIADIAERLGDVGARVDLQTSPYDRQANLFTTYGTTDRAAWSCRGISILCLLKARIGPVILARMDGCTGAARMICRTSLRR